MQSKNKPLSDEGLREYEATRDFTSDLIQSIREMKAGLGTVVYSPTAEARRKVAMTESEFAAALDISIETLHEWEHGLGRQPEGAAYGLVAMALKTPEEFLNLVRSNPSV
jgi:putative transcriptional regulator